MKLPLSPEDLSIVSEAITNHCIERIEESGTYHFDVDTLVTLSGKQYLLVAECTVNARIKINRGSIEEPPTDESAYRFEIREDVLLSEVYGNDDTYIHWKIVEDFIKKSV